MLFTGTRTIILYIQQAENNSVERRALCPKKNAIDVKTLILCAVIIVGLVLTIIGFVGNFLKTEGLLGDLKLADISDLNDLAKKLNIKFDGFAATNAFAWISFILAIVVTVFFAVVKFLGIKGLDMVVALVGCLTIVAAILVFVFAIVMANKHDISIAAGPVLMLIGGLLAGGAAAVGSLFQKDKKDVTIEEIHKEEYDKSGKSRV